MILMGEMQEHVKKKKKEKQPRYYNVYHPGFIDASKIIVVAFENGQFNYYSAVDFGLTKIPVEIETISLDDPFWWENKYRYPYLIVCENYYLIETLDIQNSKCGPKTPISCLGTPIACLHHDATKEYDPRCKNIFDAGNQKNEKFQLLIHVNPAINKFYEPLCSSGVTYYVSPYVEEASIDECCDFLIENVEALNNLYETIKRTYEAIEEGNHFKGPQLTLRRGPGITTMYR